MRIFEIAFSPTGGTKRVAECLCAGLANEYISLDLCSRSFDPASVLFGQEDLCFVSVPSYGGRVPALAAERIGKLSGAGAMAAAVVVYGNRAYDDTLLELKALLTDAGFRCIAGVAAVAEHSMLRQYAAGRPDADDANELSAFAQRIKEAAVSGSASSDISVPGSFPYRQIGAFLKPEVTEKCTGCGTCAAQCPAGAIPADHPAETDPDACISCVRCVSVCPAKARRLNPDTLAAVESRIGKALSGYRKNELFI